MNVFFLHDGIQQQGPFNIDELKTKSISKDTPIWYEELPDWTTAENVDELKVLFESTNPPPFSELKNSPPPLTKQQSQNADPKTTPKKKSKIFKYLFIGLGIIILIVASFLFYQYLQQEKEKNQSEQEIKSKVANEGLSDEVITQVVDNAFNQIQQDEAVKQQQKQQQIENSKKNIRNNWSDYITVERSSYTYREIGGIFDLYITINNESDYTLDNVVAKISYIKTDGSIYKTESIYFADIAPHNSSQKKAPDSDRGTRVDYLSITTIESAGFNFCYYQGDNSGNPSDPFKCN